ncbi:hypothetical protein [Streptomyces sp. NPDC013455]|uniref:hypothetical protein n=1 Tax=Streptomyces sp. NPDC013455 TaxID=3155605 RepID=UPI0033D0E2CD
MGVKMTMTTRCSVSLQQEQLRMVIIVVVLVLWVVLAQVHGTTTPVDALLERI